MNVHVIACVGSAVDGLSNSSKKAAFISLMVIAMMNVCLYVCMYVYVCVFVCMYVCICFLIDNCTYTHTYVRDINVCMNYYWQLLYACMYV